MARRARIRDPARHALQLRPDAAVARLIAEHDVPRRTSRRATVGTGSTMRPSWTWLPPASPKFLRERGYTFVQVGSQFRLTATSRSLTSIPVYQDTSDFAGVFYDTTIVPAIVHRLGLDDGRDGRRKNYDAVTWQLDQVRHVRQLPGPEVRIRPLFLPHHPYVVDAGGQLSSRATSMRADGRGSTGCPVGLRRS